LNEIIPYLAKSAVNKKLNVADAKFTAVLKDKLAAAVTRALELDVNGEHNFLVKKNFVSLLAANSNADVFMPSKPAGYCAFDSECNDGKYCTGTEKCIANKCVAGAPPCPKGDEQMIVNCQETRPNIAFSKK
jgi:hypothetical protein